MASENYCNDFEYPCGPEVVKDVYPEYFEDRYVPLARGAGIIALTGIKGDAFPLQGDAEYRGWYHMPNTAKSRWCPKQSKFDGPRPDGKTHGGVDLYSNGRERLLAITDGNVEYRTPQPNGWGNHIYLYFKRDGQKYICVYAHLDASSKFDGVKKVKAGDIIGKAGCSGNAGNNGTCYRSYKCHNKVATEDHLHLELFPFDSPQDKEDPVDFFGFNVKYDDDQICVECGSTTQLT